MSLGSDDDDYVFFESLDTVDINILPDKILVTIFEFGSRITLQNSRLPFTILASHVCRRWRNVTHMTPSVWRSISIVDPLNLTVPRFCLEKAGGEELEFYLHARDNRNIDALDLLKEHSNRLYSLSIRADTPLALFVTFAQLRIAVNAPCLKRLEVYVNANVRQLPDIFMDRPPALSHVRLEGSTFGFGSGLMRGLTSLILTRRPSGLTLPSYQAFSEMLLASPELTHLTLDGVLPDIQLDTECIQIELLSLVSLELTIPPHYESIDGIFDIITAPNLRKLKYSSNWEPAWMALDLVLPVLAAKFSGLQEFHVAITSSEAFKEHSWVDSLLFRAFPELRVFILDAFDDSHIRYFLQVWAEYGTEGNAVLDWEGIYFEMLWPKLELLVVRAPFDDDTDEPSLDGLIEFLGSMRTSFGLPFDVKQGYIFEGLGREEDGQGREEERNIITTRDRLAALAARGERPLPPPPPYSTVQATGWERLPTGMNDPVDTLQDE
ncbi:unnamed protein product [Somion occarium]|uniref:F-box domain-containing protein n=1 Tax=Somion occarium TaxID=3059160 RepID=A0ABP1CJU0_9APHY